MSDPTKKTLDLKVERRIALVGNPNVGKSAIFGLLTGKYVVVSNYPGTSVEITTGVAQVGGERRVIVDTPGANSLVPKSEDERVARDILLGGVDAVVQVIDAKNLRRGLFMTTQLAEMGLPTVLDLNMWDESLDKGIHIRVEKLAELTGSPVVRTIATQRRGIDRLLRAVPNARPPRLRVDYGTRIEEAVSRIEPLLPKLAIAPRAAALMLLAEDPALEDVIGDRFHRNRLPEIREIRNALQADCAHPLSYLISQRRATFVDDFMAQVQTTAPPLRMLNPKRRWAFLYLVMPILSFLMGMKIVDLALLFLSHCFELGNLGWWVAVLAGGVVSVAFLARHLLEERWHGDSSIADTLGRLTMDPFSAVPILIIVLYLTFKLVGQFGAGTCVDFMEEVVFGSPNRATLVIHPGDLAAAFPEPAARDAFLAEVRRAGHLALQLREAPDKVYQAAHEDNGDDLRIAVTNADYRLRPGRYAFAEPDGRRFPALKIGRVEHGFLNWHAANLGRWVLGEDSFLYEMLFGDAAGLFTVGIMYSFAIVLPIVTFFFVAFGLMEDSGYLPRLAMMADRVFKRIGLNGKAALPMVLGLGCATMATLTTRILDTRKERTIAILLLALAVPCSAQLGIIGNVLASASGTAFALYVLMIVSTLLVVGYLSARVLPGDHSDFLLEIPPFRAPQVGNVTVKTLYRVHWFLREAVPLFLLGTWILFILTKLGLLRILEAMARPVVTGLLGLPKETAAGFLLGFLRRDYAAIAIFQSLKERGHGAADPQQLLVALVVITLFVPCLANFFVMIREQGLRRAALMVAFIIPTAVLGGVVMRLILLVVPI